MTTNRMKRRNRRKLLTVLLRVAVTSNMTRRSGEAVSKQFIKVFSFLFINGVTLMFVVKTPFRRHTTFQNSISRRVNVFVL